MADTDNPTNDPFDSGSDWQRVARGEVAAEGRFAFRCEMGSTRDLEDRTVLAPWSATVWVVALNDECEDVGRRRVAEAYAVSFPLIYGPGHVLDAADEHSGDVFSAVSDLFADEMAYEALADVHLLRRGLYVERLRVLEELHGCGWAKCALANLLGGLDLAETLVLGHLPREGEPHRTAVTHIVEAFGGARFASTETFWCHTDLLSLESAIDGHLTGPVRA